MKLFFITLSLACCTFQALLPVRMMSLYYLQRDGEVMKRIVSGADEENIKQIINIIINESPTYIVRSQENNNPKVDVSEVIKMLVHILSLLKPDAEQKPKGVQIL